MVIKINQTKANLSAKFEVLIDDALIYLGESSPISSVFANSLMDSYGVLLLKTQFHVRANMKNIIPFKWIWTKKISKVCNILNDEGETVATFAHARKGFLDLSYSIWINDVNLRLYSIGKGSLRYVLVFLDNEQIGQICKENIVKNNLDKYDLYLLDQYNEFAPLLSLFTIYFDSYNYARRGEVVAGKQEKSWEWSYHKYNKLYDPEWLQTHFEIKETPH